MTTYRKWRNGRGYTRKRKASKNHECHICGGTISVNEEYYQLNYYGGNKVYPICENCWNGPKLSSSNTAQYKDTWEDATEFKPDPV